MTDQTRALISGFSEYLSTEGKGEKTIKSYVSDVEAYAKWLSSKEQELTAKLSRYHIVRYKESLLEDNLAPNTINKKVNSLSSLNEYLIVSGQTKDKVVHPNKDKIKIASGSEKQVAVLSEQEVEKLLFWLEGDSDVSQRDKAIILVLLYCGLRVSELVGLRRNDVDLLAHQLTVIGKGGKYRRLPLRADVVETLNSYQEGERKGHRLVDSSYLFLSQRAGRLDKDSVNKLLRKHGERLGMILYPHKLRRTFCTRLLNLRGVDLTTVAKLAGHASIQTTASYYINTSEEDKSKAVNSL